MTSAVPFDPLSNELIRIGGSRSETVCGWILAKYQAKNRGGQLNHKMEEPMDTVEPTEVAMDVKNYRIKAIDRPFRHVLRRKRLPPAPKSARNRKVRPPGLCRRFIIYADLTSMN